MGSNSSFFTQNSTVYTDSNPSGPVDTPLTSEPSASKSSFYGSGQTYAAIDLAAFIINISIGGASLGDSEWLFGYKFELPVSFPENMQGSEAVAKIAATSPSSLVLLKNGTQFGTLTYTGAVGVFSCPQTDFAVGDLLEVTAPSVADGALSKLSIALFGTRI